MADRTFSVGAFRPRTVRAWLHWGRWAVPGALLRELRIAGLLDTDAEEEIDVGMDLEEETVADTTIEEVHLPSNSGGTKLNGTEPDPPPSKWNTTARVLLTLK